MADVTDDMKCPLHFILMNMSLNSHMWLVATVLGTPSPGSQGDGGKDSGPTESLHG